MPGHEHILVRKTARFAFLGEPSARVRQLWIVCHGYGQLAAPFLRQFEPIADDHRLILAPEALNRFYVDETAGASHAGGAGRVGATWMTREDRLREIDDYVHYLDAVLDSLRERLRDARHTVHVLGFSQGAATASRWVARSERKPEQLILWCSLLPPDLDVSAGAELFGGTLTVVTGTRDRYLTPEAVTAEGERLRAAGVPCRFMRFDGGHRLDDDLLASLSNGPSAGRPS